MHSDVYTSDVYNNFSLHHSVLPVARKVKAVNMYIIITSLFLYIIQIFRMGFIAIKFDIKSTTGNTM